MKVDKITTRPEELEITGATLLSIEDAERFLTKEERAYCAWWWLRSPGDYSNCAARVRIGGVVYYGGNYVDDSLGCVRPALRIPNLKSSNLEIGDIFKIGEYEFKIISENLAWMYRQDIGTCCFRKNWRVYDANDYEKSDIKRFVDEWFEKLKEMSV